VKTLNINDDPRLKDWLDKCFLEMEGPDAAATLVALLAIKTLQDDPTWKVAEARVKNAVKSLCQIVWEHYHGSIDNPTRH
jgi:hypothetical protein